MEGERKIPLKRWWRELREWWSKESESVVAHRAAWEPALRRNERGIAHIQEELRQDVASLAMRADLKFECELDEAADDSRFSPCYNCIIPERELEIWIMPAAFQVSGPGISLNWEHYDFEAPARLRLEFIDGLTRHLLEENDGA